MSKSVKKYDVCIIGSGIGGLAVGAACSMLGLKTAMIEKHKIGGECLSYGTVPAKALIAAARKAYDAQQSDVFGVSYKTLEIDYKQAHQHAFDVIKQIEPMHATHRYEGLGIDIYHGSAYFRDEHLVAIEDEDFTIHAKHFVIATGSIPDVAEFPGLVEGEFYTNETIFTLEDKPDHLVVIGGGPVGIEMAQAHRRLGVNVTLLSRGTLLSKEDPELVEIVRKKLIEEGVTLIEHADIEKIAKKEVYYRHADSVEYLASTKYSHLLVATGRKPNIANLGLSKAGISYTSTGIKTDTKLRTNKKHIYALGECISAPEFSYVAPYQASVVIKNMLFKLPAKVHYNSVPRVTYSDPALAQVGRTEAQARADYKEKHLTFLRWPYFDNDRARVERRPEGMVKIIAYKKRIIGGAVVGSHAAETVQLLTLAINKKMKIADLAGYIAPACTYGEGVKQAAGDYFKSKLFTDSMKKIVRFLYQFG